MLRSSVTHLEGFDAHLKSCFSRYEKYLEHLLFHLHVRFLPWPEWVIECNIAFNFVKDTPDEIRTENFKRLMDREHSPVPLLDDEISRLEAEYQTLLVVVASLRSETTFSRAEDIWIQLLTKEVYYKRMQYLNNFSLRFFNSHIQ